MDMRFDMHTDMCMDMCRDMCMGMCMDMCVSCMACVMCVACRVRAHAAGGQVRVHTRARMMDRREGGRAEGRKGMYAGVWARRQLWVRR